MLKRRYQEEVLLSFLGFPVFCGGKNLGLTWDLATAGDAGRMLTGGGYEMKEQVSSGHFCLRQRLEALNMPC